MNVKIAADQKIKVRCSADIYPIMQQILLRENKLSRQKEHLWVVGLNTVNVIQYIELVSLGAIDATIVTPLEVYSLAVLKKVKQIIVVHNHPSGDLRPSPEDKAIIKNLIKAGEILRIALIDSLIISTEDYYSFEDNGILK